MVDRGPFPYRVLYHCEACDFTFIGENGPTLCVRCGHKYIKRAAWPPVKSPLTGGTVADGVPDKK